MKVTVSRPGELGPSELARWRALARGAAELGNPFLAPEFALTVGAARNTARVAVLEDSTGIVGFFPYERRGPLLGTAIGAGISDCQALVHAPGLRCDAADLVRACRLPVWEFDHLVATQAAFAPYHARVVGSPVIDLASGFPAYLADRSRQTSAVKTLLRKARKLEREVGPLRFEARATDPQLLRTLIRWKSDQYRRTRARDMLAVPWVLQVVTDLLAVQAPGCSGMLSVLWAGDRPVAAHFGLRSRDVLSYWFPAYDSDYGQYSAGLLLLLRLAEATAAEGVGQLDLGRGQQRYKDEFKTGEIPIAQGRVGVSRPAVLVRSVRAAAYASTSRALGHPALRRIRELAKRVRNRQW